MSEMEKIMRRKSRRLSKAQSMLEALAYDVKDTEMAKEDKKWLLSSIDTLKKAVQNDDKEDNIFNT